MTHPTIPKSLVVAVGGNATHPEEIRGTADEQKIIAARTARSLLPLAQLDNELVITHGNGPVVGKILMRQALTRDRIPPMSLDICVAHSQGGIAYLLMQALENALREADSSAPCRLPADAGRGRPCRPCLPEPDQADRPVLHRGGGQGHRRRARLGHARGLGRGWRHVVPSPKPRHIVDISLIQALARRGTVVIAGGGGGIPVVRGPKASAPASPP